MKLIKINEVYINPEAVDMIFVKYDEEQASILLRSGQMVYVGRPLDEVKKMFAD